jgi:hypothetical protein
VSKNDSDSLFQLKRTSFLEDCIAHFLKKFYFKTMKNEIDIEKVTKCGIILPYLLELSRTMQKHHDDGAYIYCIFCVRTTDEIRVE